jgi:spermidine synthase
VSERRPAGPLRIGLISAAILILELALIRQAPAEVRVLSYFTNLMLMASFFGLGLGCILSNRRPLAALLPLGLLALCGFILYARGLLIYTDSPEVHYWLEYINLDRTAPRLPLLPAAAAAFVLAAVPFVALGQALAREMDRQPRLIAYAWNIAGSLAGTALFTAGSALRVPPWVWPPLIMIVWAAVMVAGLGARGLFAVAGLPFLLFSRSPYEWHWSPYYYIQVKPELVGQYVWVNSSFHQLSFDFASGDPAYAEVREKMAAKWLRPYQLYQESHGGPPGRVLILGAGMGNDVNIARMAGAREIVAVEIDPVILDLGRKMNRSHPYADPRVRVVTDDARHFLATDRGRYDLIVFGTLDSQALLSGHSNLRLENFVYTREALADARDRLADGGFLAIHYEVFKPWLYARIYATLRAAFGDQTRIYLEPFGMLFNTTLIAAKDRPDFHDAPETIAQYANGSPSTDDWPFIYLQHPTISPLYLQLFLIMAALIAGAFIVLRRTSAGGGLHLDFLGLGAGFTLIESAAIVRLALLFGSTWLVNAVVFLAILVTCFLGNLLVLRRFAPPPAAAWIGLFAAIVVNYFFPLSILFHASGWLRAVVAGTLIGVPVLFASFCFSQLFERQTRTGLALGMNLIGAMAGGMLEYLSMLIGMRAVWLVILGVYGLALVFSLGGKATPGAVKWPREKTEADHDGA